MTQSETPPPQRQSHPTSSNLRHNSGMPWILQPDATKLPAPITRPIALQHSRAAYRPSLSLSPCPSTPFSSSLLSLFLLRLVLFLLKYGGRYLTRARKHEKVGAWHLYLYMYPHREPGGACRP
ncbi:hypothetical protein V8C43DRAFT_295980 [Trichoderma afarasin]